MPRVSAAIAACGLLAGCVVVGQTFTSQPGPVPVPRYIPVTVAARAYMAIHPAPPVPGMVAGMVVEQLGDALIPCPRHHAGSLGGPDSCGTWAGVLLTASGHRFNFYCGDRPASSARWVPCTDGRYVPEPGDYVYAPASGNVTPGHHVKVIELWAVHAEDQGVPAGGA